jgi:hypothetical protein
MFFMVHGFFGKFAVKDLAINDVIEVRIADDYFYSLLDTTQKVGVINDREQSIINGLVSRQSDILPSKILSIFHRAIIRRCNSGGIFQDEESELKSFALMINTAQRYERDIYFI